MRATVKLALLAGLGGLTLSTQIDARAAPAAKAKPQVSAAKAHADDLIEQADAKDLFKNVTETGPPSVRHLRSGLVCRFDPTSSDDMIMIYPDLAPGEDIGCRTTGSMGVETISATHREGVDIDPILAEAITAIERKYPDAKREPPITLASTPVGAAAAPAHKTVQYDRRVGGRLVVERVSVGVVNGWIIEQRLTTNPLAGSFNDAAAEADMVAALLSVGQPTP